MLKHHARLMAIFALATGGLLLQSAQAETKGTVVEVLGPDVLAAELGVAHALAEWCEVARQDGHPALVKSAQKLERHQYGIISHCRHQIHTSKLEGVNNKIKVVKRIAYGFHDLEYFALKVKQAFPGRISCN